MQTRIPLQRACQQAYHQASSSLLRNPAGCSTAGSGKLCWPLAKLSSNREQQLHVSAHSQESDHFPLHHRHDVEPEPDASPERPHVFGETFALVDKAAPPPFRSKSYNVLAATHMGVAATAFFLPDKVSSLMFEPSALNDVLIEPLLQMLSGGMLVSGAVLLVLGRLAREGKLSSNAGQRLNLGLAGFGAGAIANSILDFGTLQLVGGSAAAAVVGATLGVCSALLTILGAGTKEPDVGVFGSPCTLAGANYAHINPDGLSVPSIAKSIGQGLRRMPTFSTTMGLGYASLSTAFLVSGLAYVAAPHLSLLAVFGLPPGVASTFIWRTMGCALAMLMPAATHSLKIAADTSKLGSRHPKTVNAALLGASMAHLVVLGPLWLLQQGGEYLPAVLGLWAAAAVVASAGLLAKGGAD